MFRPMHLMCLFAVLIFSGCGPGTTSISGDVLYQGKPVIYGSVVAITRDGKQAFQGAISSDGTFTISQIPQNIGELRLCVHSPDPHPTGRRNGENSNRQGIQSKRTQAIGTPQQVEANKEWFPIPAMYGKAAESGLSVNVGTVRVNYDIELN